MGDTKDRTSFTHVLLRPQGADHSTPSPDGCRARIGIACMTKQPQHLDAWLRYHHERCGIMKFYLRVEDTPDLTALTDEWDGVVSAMFDAGGAYEDIPARQVAHVAQSIVKARADGLTHLLHVDDDELLFCAGGLGALHKTLLSAQPGTVEFHMSNIEALAPSMDCAHPFHEVHAFRHDRDRFCSYWNGKAIGVLAAQGLRAAGPHAFIASGGGGRHEIAPWVGCILHYESCSFAAWRRKFITAARSQHAHARLPSDFRFYRVSLSAAAAIVSAEATGDSAKLGAAEAEAAAVFCRYKLCPPSLPHLGPCRGPVVLDDGITLIDPFFVTNPTSPYRPTAQRATAPLCARSHRQRTDWRELRQRAVSMRREALSR